ncbi:CPBP family intramembrane glutamic endopeptidase [Cerasibacillus sp. JNUCC 74]|jgi:uncharacterized protein|uniref:CPBP family intramembrane glutamic endopeptidase n=1 Tax=Virgibacillus proomii TaxID=84407 RepID=UPI00098755CA|nr:CPBP family intramembrane glutamic endopeptidase [Virgibacillus proomii]
MKQRELILRMDNQELRKQLTLSQIIFILISLVLSFALFESFTAQWLQLFQWQIKEILFYGVLPGLVIVSIDLILTYLLPAKYYDDGGINEKIFAEQPIWFILVFSLLVAVSEELLFRGVLQTSFGYWFASLLFALVHFRYLKKPVLLISVLFVSFYLGYLFYLTENLVVTMVAHFIVDCLLGFFIRFKREVWTR